MYVYIYIYTQGKVATILISLITGHLHGKVAYTSSDFSPKRNHVT